MRKERYSPGKGRYGDLIGWNIQHERVRRCLRQRYSCISKWGRETTLSVPGFAYRAKGQEPLRKIYHVGILQDIKSTEGHQIQAGQVVAMTDTTYLRLKEQVPHAVCDLTPAKIPVFLDVKYPHPMSIARYIPCPSCCKLRQMPGGMVMFDLRVRDDNCLLCGCIGKVLAPSPDEGLCILNAGYSLQAISMRPGLGKQRSK